MLKHRILISGPTITKDEELGIELQKSAVVIKISNNSQIESFVRNQNIDLILFEILKENTSDIEMIKKVKSWYPNLAIILIDGDADRDLMAKAFKYGVKDAFRKPYMCDLIVERVNAILERIQHSKQWANI